MPHWFILADRNDESHEFISRSGLEEHLLNALTHLSTLIVCLLLPHYMKKQRINAVVKVLF